jgi:pimeloyl-ACP methyl ester carboxylesterase
VFDGYEAIDIAVAGGTIHARIGGAGPALLLLHGYPETHLMWHGLARVLAERYTVVAADLPSCGASLKPTLRRIICPVRNGRWPLTWSRRWRRSGMRSSSSPVMTAVTEWGIGWRSTGRTP